MEKAVAKDMWGKNSFEKVPLFLSRKIFNLEFLRGHPPPPLFLGGGGGGGGEGEVRVR